MGEGVDLRLRLFLQLLAVLRGHLLLKWQDQVCVFAAGKTQSQFPSETCYTANQKSTGLTLT
jgi:hypothetical protein